MSNNRGPITSGTSVLTTHHLSSQKHIVWGFLLGKLYSVFDGHLYTQKTCLSSIATAQTLAPPKNQHTADSEGSSSSEDGDQDGGSRQAQTVNLLSPGKIQQVKKMGMAGTGTMMTGSFMKECVSPLALPSCKPY